MHWGASLAFASCSIVLGVSFSVPDMLFIACFIIFRVRCIYSKVYDLAMVVWLDVLISSRTRLEMHEKEDKIRAKFFSSASMVLIVLAVERRLPFRMHV